MTRRAPLVAVVSITVVCTGPAGAPLSAQALAAPAGSPWSAGPVLHLGPELPRLLVDDPCGSRGSFGLGAQGRWVPFESQRWLMLEGDAALVVSPTDPCDFAPLPPEGERVVRESGVTAPLVAVNSRVVVELPFEPGRVRAHGGPGVLLSGLRPAANYGVGWLARSGAFTASIVVDVWRIWPGGDVVREVWSPGVNEREVIGSIDGSVSLRFIRFAMSWEVGRPFGRGLER